MSDPPTHIGAVERTESDSAVISIRRVTAAIEQYRMNLEHPCIQKAAGDRILNDRMQTKTSP